MRSANEHQDPMEGSSYRELQLLTEVEADPKVTQRQLSLRVGIALGLTNTLLRNLTQKGYVRATRANWKSWLYSLTPEGFSRKIRLTVAYVQRFVDHYQRVRQTLREQLEPLALNEESRIAMYGTGELAELVYLGLKEIGIEEIDVFGPKDLEGHRFLGMPVLDLSALRPERYDRVLLAVLQGWEVPHGALQERGVTPEKLVTFFRDNRVREGV
jgi:DNA-binding MarR family transcriptional regulator